MQTAFNLPLAFNGGKKKRTTFPPNRQINKSYITFYQNNHYQLVKNILFFPFQPAQSESNNVPRITSAARFSQLSRAFLTSARQVPTISFILSSYDRINPRPNNAMCPDAMEYASNPMHPVHRRGLLAPPVGRSNRKATFEERRGRGTKMIYPLNFIELTRRNL